MFNKSVLSLVLSFSMLISPLPNGGSTGSASAGGTAGWGAGSSLVETDETVTPGDAAPGDDNTGDPGVGAAPQANPFAVFSGRDAANAITSDFEADDVGSWGFTAAGGVTIEPAAENSGNKYLKFNPSGRRNTTVSPKSFGEMPKMGTATIAFKWYYESLVTASQQGFAGFKFSAGDSEVLSLYFQENKARTAGTLFYSLGGEGGEVGADKTSTGKTADNGTWHDFEIALDFAANTAVVKMDGQEAASVGISQILNKVDGMSFMTIHPAGGSNTVTAVMGIDNFSFTYEEPQANKGSIVCDFENETAADWGMTGELATSLSIATEDSGNKYLLLEREKASTRFALKSWENIPRLSQATVSFDWYINGLTTDGRNGFAAVQLKSAGTEVFSLYHGDVRAAGDTAPLYYSAEGFDNKTASTANVTNGGKLAVEIVFDFEAHKAVLKIDGVEIAQDISISQAAAKVDQFEFFGAGSVGSGRTFTWKTGIDNFKLEYTESLEQVVPSIFKLTELPNVGTTQTKYQAGYTHPASVEATLLTGDKITVPVKADTWTSTPAFDANTAGVYTWEAEIEAPAENPNVNNLKASYQMKYDVLRTPSQAEGTVAVRTDFESESAADWGITPAASVTAGVVDDAVWTGNKLLQIKTSNVNVATVSPKSFGTLPKMTTAKMEFKWYVATWSSTSRLGWQGLTLMSGENELLTLYLNDIRGGESKPLYYSVKGFDGKQATNVNIASDSWNDVELIFDFSAHKLDVKVNGSTAVSADILEVARKVDGLSYVTEVTGTENNKINAEMAIDNFLFTYVQDTSTSEDKVTIYSLDALPTVKVTQEEWEAGAYAHPATVSATLSDGEKTDVQIKADTWTCPDFDPARKGIYTWTAEIIAPEKYENTKNLKASYQMEYHAALSANHDYYNDFTFSSEIWDSVAWGKSMDSTSGTGGFTLSHDTDSAGNGYMKAFASGRGDRGSRLDLSTKIIKGAEISFDWMPIDCTFTSAEKANGQLMFVSTDKWHPYFVLRFDENYNISFFTENPLGGCSTTQEPFAGSISGSSPTATGLGGQNKWFSVSLSFDYLGHTADLTVTDKADPSKTFTQTDIPIETAANGIRAMVVHMYKIAHSSGPSTTMGLDNVIVDYVNFSETEVVSVKNPANVNVAQTQYNDFQFPTAVEVTLGDGSKLEVPVGQWTADPAFDLATSEEGQYVWSAPLVLDGLTNVFGLSASFTMNYTKLPFPLYVYNPNTLELPFGEPLPASFPVDITAKMSSGEIGTVKAGSWTAIREFNAAEEGIYVYGANIVPVDGEYCVDENLLTPNENPAAPGEHQTYDYDVYYRVSYFKSNDSYNAYQRSMEYLDRGVYAVAKDNGVFVSWRLLVSEYGEDIAFNVYRNGELANETPITTKTNFVDAAGKAGDVYTVAKLKDGLMYESKEVKASAENYMSIPLQKPDPQPAKNGNLSAYTINDAGVADVDGDGEYEIIVKWYPDNSFDSGNASGPSSPTIFDIYEMDGTPLWRLNLGLELPSGAHFNQFMLYDMNEDGKAELFIKTSDGTVSYKPNAEGKFDMTDESTIVSYIGDRSVKPGTNIGDNGHVNGNSNEYVTVFNGLTGEEISTVSYPNTTGDFTDWGTTGGGGNDNGNRSARYNIAVAYLPKTAGGTETIPAVLLNRGYYDKTTVAAYTLRDGKLNLEWNFVREKATNESGKGNHNVSTGDIDKDGFDELIIGAMAIDHDGSVLWVKDGQDGQDFAGHADTIHLAAMNPENNDLYVFVPAEEQNSTVNHSLSNAATGARLNGSYFTRKDVGRAVAANITPRPGYEYWSASGAGEITSGIYGFDGSIIATTKPVPMNWRMFWDGDLLSELADGIATDDDWTITKYNWEDNTLITLATLEGTKTNNSTKKTPSLTADLFGDWREEVMLRNDDDTELRIYMTTDETDYMIYTLMHDPVYRNAVANQNTAYNQPPHIGFYLGADNADTVLAMGLPTANVRYTLDVTEEGKPIPTPGPAPEPTAEPTAQPTAEPGVEPTAQPTAQPTQAPADDDGDDEDDEEDDEPAATEAPTKAPAPTQRPVNPRPASTPRPVATTAPTAKPAATATPKPQATAAPTAKPESTSKPAADNTLTFDFGRKDEIPAAELNDTVKKNTGCETVEQLTNYMKSAIEKQFAGNGEGEPVYTAENTVVLNITVLVGGQPATKENFPKEGVDVIIPYPQGTDKTNFDFVVGHMPTNDWNGANPGVMEYLDSVKTDQGLKVHISSASPFVVSWSEIASPASSGDTVTGKNFTVWIIVGVLAVALVGVGVAVFVQQKKKNEEE